MSKPRGRLAGAVWHADPCAVYCDPKHQLDGKEDKPKLTGAAGRWVGAWHVKLVVQMHPVT